VDELESVCDQRHVDDRIHQSRYVDAGRVLHGNAALVDPTRRFAAKASYAGIAIDPTTGVIALADYDRGQIIKLTPFTP
jgi:hypothetical protein